MFLAIGFVPTLFVLELVYRMGKAIGRRGEVHPLCHSLIVGLGCYLFKQQGYSLGAAITLFINKEDKFVNHQ